MNKQPGLLKYSSQKYYPSSVAADVEAASVFSDSAVSILLRPCGGEEIVKRQEFFGLLEVGGNYKKFESILDVLRSHRRRYETYRAAKNNLEQYFAFISLIKSYREVCRTLSSVRSLGAILLEISDYYAKRLSEITALEPHILRAEEIIDIMRSGILSFSDRKLITPDTAPTDEIGEIFSAALALGLEVPPRRKLSAKIDKSLSKAVCALYPELTEEFDSIIARFDSFDLGEAVDYISEIEFFFEMLGFAKKAHSCGMGHCYPNISDTPKFRAENAYDVTLIEKSETIVPNDIDMSAEESFFFITGANGGGKTTYLRTVGVNLLLFLAGCPVFAEDAEIYPFDHFATHFCADERFDGVGRFDDEVLRAEKMLGDGEGGCAFFLFNESFGGTDDTKGFEYAKLFADRVASVGHFALFVTHFHQVAATEYPILTAVIEENDENRRTYKMRKMRGNASSYARDILKKYRLDRESLEKRRRENGN